MIFQDILKDPHTPDFPSYLLTEHSSPLHSSIHPWNINALPWNWVHQLGGVEGSNPEQFNVLAPMGRRVFGEKNIYLALVCARNHAKLLYIYFSHSIFTTLLCRFYTTASFSTISNCFTEMCWRETNLKCLLHIRYLAGPFNMLQCHWGGKQV